MANASAISLPRIEKSGSVYASSEDLITLRLNNNFDDIIEKIESLRLARDHEIGNRTDSLIDLFDRKTREPEFEQSTDNCQTNLNSQETTVHKRDNDSYDVDDGPNVSDRDSDDGKSVTDDNNESDSVDYEEKQLIERGPIKSSQSHLTNRESPYWTTSKQIPALKQNEMSFSTDETITEETLGDTEYRKNLNVCLYELKDAVKTASDSWSESKDQSALEACNSDNNYTFDPAILNDASKESLMELLEVLQPAQLSSSKYLSSPDATISGYDSHALSGSESRGSSPTCSLSSATCAEYPRTIPPNFICSPIGSPRVSNTMYRTQQISSSSSSNSPFYFSSSSNQSYSDSPSPHTTHQVPIASQIGERLDEDIENSFWNIRSSNGEVAEANKVNENIDTDLELIEEVLLKDLKKEEHVKKNSMNVLSCLNEFAREESLENSSIEQYLVRFDVTNSNVRSNCNGTVADVTNSMSKSNVSYQTYRNVPDSTVPRIEVTNPIPTDAIVPNYSNNGSPGIAQKGNWTTEPEIINTCSNSRQIFDFPSLFLDSPDFSSLSLHTGVTSNVDALSPPFDRCRIRSFDEFKPARQANVTNKLQNTKLLSPLASPRSQRRQNSDRNIMPWPSLNLPSVRASERLKQGLNPKEVEKAMSSLLKRSVEELAKQDEDGDTMLMCLVGNSEELAKKKAYLVPLVERLSTMKGALSIVNDHGEDALYLAALNCPQFPYVTGYLAATMVQKGIDVSQKLYHIRGDTLIHSIAEQGDSHGEVLAELLALKTKQGNPVFDLSKRNYDGKTALHVAIESHDPSVKGISSVATVQLLLKYGADPKIKGPKCGDTALHMAVSLGIADDALLRFGECNRL
ncbi:uncharacterized protein LOC143185733 isoform X2 [Calliopsis andreniformis]|uniref:uncharacterized protein LOC143185733 isoform X2 n=1 Tax=Calliopsis andreniformis TaxID=337506 RepID=UPI003FCD48B1